MNENEAIVALNFIAFIFFTFAAMAFFFICPFPLLGIPMGIFSSISAIYSFKWMMEWM